MYNLDGNENCTRVMIIPLMDDLFTSVFGYQQCDGGIVEDGKKIVEDGKKIEPPNVRAFWGQEPDFLLNLVEDMDQLALTVAKDLDVDRVLIGIVHDEQLFSVGEFPTVGPSFGEREHCLDNTMCSVTMETGVLVEVPDTRADAEFSNATCVVSGKTVGYMGVPIRNREMDVVGAVCCVTNEPRNWVTFERKYVEQIARNAELILFRGRSREELSELTKDLGDMDQILSALSSQAKMPVSIYKPDGELVFVNAALTDHVPIEIVADYLFAQGLSKFQNSTRAGVKSATSGQIDATVLVPVPDRDQTFSVSTSISTSGLIVCTWFQRPKTVVVS